MFFDKFTPMFVKYELKHSQMSLLLFICFPLVNIRDGKLLILLPFIIEYIQDHVCLIFVLLFWDVYHHSQD